MQLLLLWELLLETLLLTEPLLHLELLPPPLLLLLLHLLRPRQPRPSPPTSAPSPRRALHSSPAPMSATVMPFFTPARSIT